MIRSLLSRLRRDRRGNVAMMFALTAVPLVTVIGMGVDLGNATRVRLKLQDATDSAVLAVARDGLKLTDAQIQSRAKTYVDASYNYGQAPYTVTKLTFDRSTVTAVLETKASVPTGFMAMFGVNTLPVTAHAVSKGLGFEIALVLDNSGSMDEWAGTSKKISALKSAADSFLDVMFGSTTVSERFNISIVPFSTAVNVGSGYKTASWMDKATTPAASIHDENFANNVNRFSLFAGGANGMRNETWAGCVITRYGSYATDDTTPSSGDTLFTPWFAPDESDLDNYKSSGSGRYDYRDDEYFSNNYLDDEGGNCSGSDDTEKATNAVKQARTCKYKNATPSTSNGKGPNYGCTTTAITPLTNARSTLDNAISAMAADGNTNILEGITWGWRTLSSNEPFTQGKAYSAPNNRKVIILMTDGENNIGSIDNDINKTPYSSFGYASNRDGSARLGSPASGNTTTNTARLDAKTLTACTNAKAKGIIIYTIAFDLDSSSAQTLLKACASKPDYPFFNSPKTSSELTPVFLAIAQSINSLRLAE